ncbi:hypothetical protein G6F46_014728 [Rhizopus delemar]|uniref:Uncharacterized protein n=1 Tax=Rhizopus oryzae TaxID=64495 RepID=A0A9P6XL72_RHIOR|nr:hypothetical protein G6F56_014177 [Rhizopus delemar]KAG1522150.1 hypothetical protein G6F51_014628 [Rhizopus arrhizus]KAG1587639.1 hypothetical protein G6F46_014728 [Rhizopus delemar]
MTAAHRRVGSLQVGQQHAPPIRRCACHAWRNKPRCQQQPRDGHGSIPVQASFNAAAPSVPRACRPAS